MYGFVPDSVIDEMYMEEVNDIITMADHDATVDNMRTSTNYDMLRSEMDNIMQALVGMINQKSGKGRKIKWKNRIK